MLGGIIFALRTGCPWRLLPQELGCDSGVTAGEGGEATGPNPTDRGKPGSKYHLVVDRNGGPLAVRLSAANAHDSTQLLALIGLPGRPGRPSKRPAKLHADKAYDTGPKVACPARQGHQRADRAPWHRVE